MSSSLLSRARERSKLRKELLKTTLGVDDLKSVLGGPADRANAARTAAAAPSNTPTAAQRPAQERLTVPQDPEDDPREKRAKGSNNTIEVQRIKRTRASQESDSEHASSAEKGKQEFSDSTAFLKGTQSLNPHNDYSQNFVDTHQRPQNFIRDVGLADRFEEYPKLRELIRLKNELVSRTAPPPMYLKADLETFDLKSLGHQFDVILIEPPLEEYARSYGVKNVKFWDWERVMALDIAEVAAPRSFVFLWCGSSDGLDLGRLCLQTWGFRRCEDICWIQTNHKKSGIKVLEPNAVFQRTKEHCLMGIKGTVRRSTDGDFIHANVDIDLIIDEEAEPGSLDKPVEMFHIIEHFCLGRRRLHIFGRDSTIRPGWLTIGDSLSTSNYDRALYTSYFEDRLGMSTGCTERIEALRPKSPPPKSGGRGRGRGTSRGGGRGRGGGAM